MSLIHLFFGFLRALVASLLGIALFWGFTFLLVVNYEVNPQNRYRNVVAYNPPPKAGLTFHVAWLVKASWKNVQMARTEYQYGYHTRRNSNSLASMAGEWVGKTLDEQRSQVAAAQ